MDLTVPDDLVQDVDGRWASPATAAMYARMREVSVESLDSLGVEPARVVVEESVRGQRDPETVINITDMEIPTRDGNVPARLYQSASNSTDRASGTIVYLHGGGWVTGSVATADTLCRELAAATGYEVVSIEYRRAPEHHFPKPVEDAIDAVTYIADNAAFPSERLVVAGDSAGGYLAYVTSIARSSVVTDLILFYPAVRPPAPAPPASWTENQHDLVLPARTMRWFWDQFRGTMPLDDSRLVPASPSDENFPRTFLITCGLDVLRDEGDRLAADLALKGVDTRLNSYPGAPHGFLSFTKRLPFGADALLRASRWLQRGT